MDIIELVKGSFCTTKSQFCSERLEDIDTISALTLDYSSNANEVLITATWPLQSRKDVVRKVSVDHRVEVGILAREENSDTEKIGLGGWLTVLGQDDRPSMLLSDSDEFYELMCKKNLLDLNSFRDIMTILQVTMIEIAVTLLYVHATPVACIRLCR